MPRSAIAGFGALLAGLALAVVPAAARAQQQTLEQSVSTQNRIVKDAAATQAKINGLADQTQKLLDEYLAGEQQLNQLKKYNDNLQALISDQHNKIVSLNQQMGQIGGVEQGIVPLMEQMIGGLGNFVRLGLPYQLPQREAEVKKLHDLMTDSDVAISEKYHQITSAYLDELDAGNTMDAYKAQLSVNGKTQTVDMLRVGRVVLCYQTLNQEHTGCWNQRTHQWVASGDYRLAVSTGLAMARKQQQPTLLTLPVVAPVAAPPQAEIIPSPQTVATPASPPVQPATAAPAQSAPAPQTSQEQAQ